MEGPFARQHQETEAYLYQELLVQPHAAGSTDHQRQLSPVPLAASCPIAETPFLASMGHIQGAAEGFFQAEALQAPDH
jgi:hypothetical protein